MRTIYVLLVAALVAVGMAACSKDDKTVGCTDENSVGEVRVTLGFGKSTETKAIASSTAKPTTAWNKNIKDLMILFVEDGRVKDARKIFSLPTAGDISSQIFTLTNIKASASGKQYTVYVIANSQQAAIKTEIGGNGKTWNENSCVGQPVTALLMKLVVNPEFAPQGDAEAGAVGYSEPAEIFVGKTTNVVIADGNPATITASLERAVSMLRVRINQSLNGNDLVDFTGNSASFRIRRATTAVTPEIALSKGGKTDVLYTKSPFLSTEPGSGYEGGTILNPSEKITLWKDIRMLPGGSTSVSAEKFDIVLIGRAQEGYIPLGKTTGLTQPADVAWTAAVSTAIGRNEILEINLTLERAGAWLDDPENPGIPDVGEYGNADVNVNLVPWGNIVSEDIPV